MLLINDSAYGFYYSLHGYLNAKNNYKLHGDEFNYPCLICTSFDDNLKCIKMNRIVGVSYKDRYHDDIIIKKLLEFGIEAKSKIGSGGEALFLQHGDASRNNVIWVNEEEFFFIDLDNMNYYPPFLDIFHYLCNACYDLDEIVHVLNANYELLRKNCIRIGIDMSDNPLDILFYNYVKHYRKMGACFEDFRFLNKENTQQYPKTNEILCTIE